MLHSLPTHVYQAYTQPVKDAQVLLKRSVIAPYGAAALVNSYPNAPINYLLIDIGAEMTTVSLIGEGRLYGSTHFSWGGDKITERIITTFNINENDAEKYKITYGIDNRKMNFNAPVCKSSDGEGNEIKHYSDELNEIIKSELGIFLKDLDASIDELLKTYDKTVTKKLPMVLIGGGAKLNGLVEYLKPKVESEDVIVVTPRNLGARDATFTNCLGLILASKAGQTPYDDLDVDKMGRVQIPTAILNKYHIGKDVVVQGCGKHIEVWDAKKYEDYMSSIENDFEGIAERLSNK